MSLWLMSDFLANGLDKEALVLYNWHHNA